MNTESIDPQAALDHPSDNDLLMYAIGIPSDELVAFVDEHVAVCGDCARAVVELVREQIRNDALISPTPNTTKDEAVGCVSSGCAIGVRR